MWTAVLGSIWKWMVMWLKPDSYWSAYKHVLLPPLPPLPPAALMNLSGGQEKKSMRLSRRTRGNGGYHTCMETSGGGAHNWNLVVLEKGRTSVWLDLVFHSSCFGFWGLSCCMLPLCMCLSFFAFCFDIFIAVVMSFLYLQSTWNMWNNNKTRCSMVSTTYIRGWTTNNSPLTMSHLLSNINLVFYSGSQAGPPLSALTF